ncbi:MAG: hypothetical protein AAGG45_09970, partial [Pseudomonadota bacterium]
MKLPTITLALSVLAVPAFAEATGDEIKAAIEGNTVQGGMDTGEAYSEFYEAGGAIKAEGYGGTWAVKGDTMCFDYGEGENCWGVRIEGDQVTWLLDGADDGTGTIVSGNPN